ncbi:phosphotransferase family protein [Microlunatus sp. GCM10028923]|uniref:phosphotransferase family protein n=1 Tax=Microlunatus sp. GCM10028923 TaxID=3273400 RepID=UPI00361D17E0
MITDPALPGLATLLGLPGLTQLRYKPGTSCVAAITHPDGDAFGYVVSAAARPKLDKLIRKAPPGTIIDHDRDRNLIIARAAADRDLPALADPAAATAALLPGPAPEFRTLAYKPQRRWVALASRGSGEPVLVRAYRRTTVADAQDRLAWFGRLTGTRRSLGWDAERAVIITGYEPGVSLADLIGTGAATDAMLTGCGVALARLHDQPPVPGPAVRQADPAATVALIRILLPGQAARAEAILDRLRASAPAAVPPVPCHGDFSVDQVIIPPTGAAHPEPTLIDFDRSGLGDPAADLAGLQAAGLGPAAVDRVLAGYRTVRPVPAGLDWHRARALLLRAAEPFRTALPDWPDRIPVLLARIEETLP